MPPCNGKCVLPSAMPVNILYLLACFCNKALLILFLSWKTFWLMTEGFPLLTRYNKIQDTHRSVFTTDRHNKIRKPLISIKFQKKNNSLFSLTKVSTTFEIMMICLLVILDSLYSLIDEVRAI